MPRFKVNVRFGPWRVGDVFESHDDYHALMAQDGHYLTELGGPEPELEDLGEDGPAAALLEQLVGEES